jgi:hypothetical protein
MIARLLIALDEWYAARHRDGDGPLVRRFNAWINRRAGL